jgi:hypothetical protein
MVETIQQDLIRVKGEAATIDPTSSEANLLLYKEKMAQIKQLEIDLVYAEQELTEKINENFEKYIEGVDDLLGAVKGLNAGFLDNGLISFDIASIDTMIEKYGELIDLKELGVYNEKNGIIEINELTQQ